MEPHGSPSGEPSRPAPTGWPGRPDLRLPGSAAATGSPRPDDVRGSGAAHRSPAPDPTAATPAAPPPSPSLSGARSSKDPEPDGAPPVRPPVAAGIPPRSAPLPPPRTTPPPEGPAVAGSLGAATVVPDKVRRPAPRPVSRPGPVRGRKAKLAVKRLDPWSVFVTSLVLSLLLAVATIIAAFLLYAVLSGLGVPQSINSNVGDITKTSNVLTRGKFVGIAALIAGANVVLLTALATLGAMLYNLVSTFTGGVELTLAERD